MIKRIVLLSCIALLCVVASGSLAAAAVGQNQVNSASIVDGQVMTVDLANGSVTSAKILDGTIATADLASGAVTDAKITGPISASKVSSTGLNADTVDGKHAADLATAVHAHAQADVTGLGTALAGKAAVGHDHDGTYAKKYARLVVVSTDGNGDFASPVDAMNAITDAGPANPYLVKIMPGVYDIGAGVVQMKEYVDIEGSGEGVTKITGNVSTDYIGNSTAFYGVVMGANNAELRSLTVENAGPGPLNMSIAIANVDTSPRISHVTVLATNGANWTEGILNHWYASPTLTNLTIQVSGTARSSQGIANSYGAPVIRNTTIVSTGAGGEIYGIYNGDTGLVKISDTTITVTGGSWRNMGIHNSWHSALELTNVTISSPGPVGEAIWCYGSTGAVVTINRSTLEGGVNSIMSAGGYNVKVGASQLIGAVSGDPSVCVGAYDGNYNPLSANCQP